MPCGSNEYVSSVQEFVLKKIDKSLKKADWKVIPKIWESVDQEGIYFGFEIS
jgi:hypothetical protein